MEKKEKLSAPQWLFTQKDNSYCLSYWERSNALAHTLACKLVPTKMDGDVNWRVWMYINIILNQNNPRCFWSHHCKQIKSKNRNVADLLGVCGCPFSFLTSSILILNAVAMCHLVNYISQPSLKLEVSMWLSSANEMKAQVTRRGSLGMLCKGSHSDSSIFCPFPYFYLGFGGDTVGEAVILTARGNKNEVTKLPDL